MKIINFKTGNRKNALSQNERGATMLEYGVMVALIVITSIAVVTSLGQSIKRNGFAVILAASGDVE